MGRLHALLVGIDAYRSPVPPLAGCLNDVKRMREFLEHRGGDASIHTLTDEEATRAAVIDAFRSHLGAAGAADTALFYYSGHGSQEPTPPELLAIEPDGLDETLVLFDSRTEGQFDLADKELGKLISEVAESGAHVVVILDSCHSGTATRALGETVRRAPSDQRPRPLKTFLHGASELAGGERDVGGSAWLTSPSRHVLLAACRDEEEAKEIPLDGERRGVFSYFLVDALQQATAAPTYRDLHRQVSAQVRGRVARQWPDFEAIEAGDMDRPFLGGAVPDRAPHVTVSRDPKYGWVIDSGAVHGIPRATGEESTRLALFDEVPPPGKVDAAAALGEAHVTEVLPHVCRVELDLTDGDPDPARTYKAIVVSLPLPKLPVGLKGDPQALDLIRTALRGAGPGAGPTLYVEEAPAGTAELAVEALPASGAEGARYRILRSAERRPVVADLDGFTEASARELVARLEHIARWTRLAQLRNPGSRLAADAVEMRVFAHDPDRPDALEELSADAGLTLSYATGEDGEAREPSIKISLRNASNERLHCVLLDLTETYGVGLDLIPAGSVQLDPGQELWVWGNDPIPVTIPQGLHDKGYVELKDILKLIVSTEPLDPTALAEADLEEPTRSLASVQTRGAKPMESTLDRLVRRVALRHIGAASQRERVADWTTRELTMTVLRPRDAALVPPVGDSVELAAGVTLDGHPGLTGAAARLTTAPLAVRSLDGVPLPPLLLDDPAMCQPLELVQTRSGGPGLSALELSSDALDTAAVTPAAPLIARVAEELGHEEHVLPLAWDGEFWLPLGHARRRDGATEIVLERLPAPVQGSRDLRGSIRILFQKIVGRKLGLGYDYPHLSAVDRAAGGELTYEHDPQKVAARVAAADRVVLFVHGIIGDTRAMAASAYGPRLGGRYDLVLAFDYENINTPIEETARLLGQRLAAVGLAPGHDKVLHIVAHSMGGLVSRWFVEREGGAGAVGHLVMLGTPNAGSPWPKVQDWGTVALSLGMNALSATFWPAHVVPALLKLIEKVDVTLDQMNPGSTLLEGLAASGAPGVGYTLLAGNTSIPPAALTMENGRPGRAARLLSKILHGAAGVPFFGQPNDIAVSVASAEGVPSGWTPRAAAVEVACDHLTYFVSEQSLGPLSGGLPRDERGTP